MPHSIRSNCILLKENLSKKAFKIVTFKDFLALISRAKLTL